MKNKKNNSKNNETRVRLQFAGSLPQPLEGESNEEEEEEEEEEEAGQGKDDP